MAHKYTIGKSQLSAAGSAAASNWPVCARCGGEWLPRAGELHEPWCSPCRIEHSAEYRPIYAAWVRERPAVHLARAGVPPRFQSCTLAGLRAQTAEQKRVLAEIARWAEMHPPCGLFLYGAVGPGKTHLAAAALLELMAQRRRGRFASVHELLLEAGESFFRADGRRLSEILEELSRPDVLLLDDLGSEKGSDFRRDVLLTLVDRAYNHHRPLVIATSNHELPTLARPEYLGPRTADRLRELCLVIELGGHSLRRARQPRRAAKP